MATRSTVTIRVNAGPTLHLYRYNDGGPWGTGSDISRRLRAWTTTPIDRGEVIDSITDMVTRMIRSGDYRLTDDACCHADNEWHYDVEILAVAEDITVTIRARCPYDDVWRTISAGRVATLRAWIAVWVRDTVLTAIRRRRRVVRA